MDDIPDQVIAKRFVMVDDDGKPLASLAQLGELIGLSILGEDNTPLAFVGVRYSDGEPHITLRRPASQGEEIGVVDITILADGQPGISVQDADGNFRSFGI